MTTEKIEGAGKVTIELDLVKFVANTWQGDDGEYQDDSNSPRDQIIERAAQMLRKDIGVEIIKDVRAAVESRIDTQVGDIIKDALEGEFTTTNDYGTRGKPTTLREQIGKEATTWLTSRPKNRYSDQTNFQKILKDMVDRQLAKEFTAIIADERAKIVTQLRGAAADLLAKEAAKR
jgi:hypothetical protein